jgi:hypothetical protein
MHEEGEYIVEWHYDGYHQVILNVCGVDKTFQLSPPPPGHLCDESGWLPAEQYPKAAKALVLRPGDVSVFILCVLPAAFSFHHVMTASCTGVVSPCWNVAPGCDSRIEHDDQHWLSAD